jgi:regulator of protease activity HflC (stomatin/prohibitin superfamily)
MRKITVPAIVLALLAFIAVNAAFVIDQAEQGIIVQFGDR